MNVRKIILLLLILNTNNLFAQINLNQGLVAYYPFNGNANDESGNGINGVVNGATLTVDAKGFNNNAFEFNGVSDYITLPYNSKYNFSPNDSFSISCWIQPYNNPFWSTAQAIIVKSPFDINYQSSMWNYGLYSVNDKAMTGWAANNFLNATTTMQRNKCWYHLAVTYKNGIWHLYVNGKVEAKDLSQTKFIIQDGSASNIAFGRKGNANGDYYKGKLDEVRIYNRALNDEEILALNYFSKPEFSFTQNVCNPKQISFKNESTNFTKFYWNLGNGVIDSSNNLITTNYNSFGNYKVQLITTNAFGCNDTTIKNITISQQQDSNLITNRTDTTLCAGASFKLNIKDTGLGYCWSSSNNSLGGNLYNPTVSPVGNVTYYLNTQKQGNNLVINGDFEQGNVGFNSDYVYETPPNTTDNTYFITNNPQSWNNAFTTCGDHSTGFGNMLVINGSTILNNNIWSQNISIQKNQNYAFSIWLKSVFATNPSIIKFSINGIQVGNLITASSNTCQWQNFYVIWNSGSSVNAKISITNQNNQFNGNDFALDDISFTPIQIVSDSINVVVKNCPTPIASFTMPDTICVNEKFTIQNTSTGASTYNWNFCKNLNATNVDGVNLGNPNNTFEIPLFMDYTFFNGNYYAFITNHGTGKLTRLNFGNSLLNNPTAIDLGNFNGQLQTTPMGIQIIEENGEWYAVIVGGDPNRTPPDNPFIGLLSFGPNLLNNNPTFNNYSNIGNLSYPTDLHLFKENNNWYGITFNARNNTFTRFDFGNSIVNIPTGTNLGNLGMGNYVASSFFPYSDNNLKHIFALGHNNKVFRLDFGNSYLNNAPLVSDLSNFINGISTPMDLLLLKTCKGFTGFIINGTNSTLLKLNFSTITSNPTSNLVSTNSDLNAPRTFSKTFYENGDYYAFVMNYGSKSISRIKLTETCTNASIPNSTQQDPPSLSYNAPGAYNINLTINKGLPTESSACKTVVVKSCPTPIVSFTAPDTICVNEKLTINNTSTGASTYHWNFCKNQNATNIDGVNLGNVGNNFNSSVFMDYAFDNGNYYAFVISHASGKITRLEFGNSLLNTPSSVSLTTLNGIVQITPMGIQIINENGNWYGILVSGDSTTYPTDRPKIILINFGQFLNNNNPTYTDYGNIGNLNYPSDLQIFKENGNWYGLTANIVDNTFTRFNFGNRITNIPTALNLGNFGIINQRPSGFYTIQENGQCFLFLTCHNNKLYRLNFGSSFTNNIAQVSDLTPSVNGLDVPGDIIILKSCNGFEGYVVNYTTSELFKLNFSSLNALPTSSLISANARLNGPRSFSKPFIENEEIYVLVPNYTGKSVTRIKLTESCNNASLPSSTLQNPPTVSYNAAGTYNISLTVDEGLPTQSNFCKQVVVKNCDPTPNPNCIGSITTSKSSRIEPKTPINQYLGSNGFTWECWFNSSYYSNSSTKNTRNKIISVLDAPQCQDVVLGFGWPQVAEQRQLCFVVDGPNGCANRDNNPCTYVPNGGFLPNTWYHVAAVKNNINNTTSLYVNGVLVDSKSNNKSNINPILGSFFGIGSYTFGLLDSSFEGKLDEIRMWNYPRSATEIANNYNKCIDANENGLMAYYRCNEISIPLLKDATNKNDASFPGSSTRDKTMNAPLINTCYQSNTDTTYKTICSGSTYLGYSTTGFYNLTTLTNSYGCDSVRFLDLKVLANPKLIKDTIQNCGSIVLNGQTYLTNVLVTDTIKSTLGCDSVYNQHQLIITKKTSSFSIQICAGNRYWNKSVTGSYDSTFKLANNCDSIVTLNLTVVDKINDTIRKNICFGESYRGFFMNHIFKDTIRGLLNCDTIRTEILTVRSKIETLLPNTGTICENQLLKLYPGIFRNYLWSTGSIDSSINVKNAGIYWVKVTDSNNCTQNDTFNLTNVYTLPQNFLIPNNIIACYGEKYALNGFNSYLWNTGETANTISLNGLSQYFVTVTNSNGCLGKDTLFVNYENKFDNSIPSAFSPNGDGINDEFIPFKNSSCLKAYNITIFDRYGQKVFESINPLKPWKGKVNSSGKDAPINVYFYIINYTTSSNLKELKSGYLTLLR